MARSIRDESYSVKIEGLAAFTRALKVADGKFESEIKEANYDVANEIVQVAKGKAQGGVAPKAARSLRAGKALGSATISGGGARAPYFFGAEFGSKRYGQFKSWRGNQWGGWSGGPGYFLHPSIREEGPQAVERYMKRIDDITDSAFNG